MSSSIEERAFFPPMITPHRLREREDAFAAACAGASEVGAGNLYFVGRFELIEFAIVLEPQEPLRLARKIIFAGMNALADALAVLSPPEKMIHFDYPGVLFFDGALIGGMRLAWPEGANEEEPPDWLVLGAMVRAGGVHDLGEGLGPQMTTLDDEGFEAWNPSEFSASFARHFLVEVDSWNESGFKGIGPRYLSRLNKGDGEGRRGIDTNGDLLIHPEAKNASEASAKRLPFVRALKAAAWYDPLLNEPKS